MWEIWPLPPATCMHAHIHSNAHARKRTQTHTDLRTDILRDRPGLEISITFANDPSSQSQFVRRLPKESGGYFARIIHEWTSNQRSGRATNTTRLQIAVRVFLVPKQIPNMPRNGRQIHYLTKQRTKIIDSSFRPKVR